MRLTVLVNLVVARTKWSHVTMQDEIHSGVNFVAAGTNSKMATGPQQEDVQYNFITEPIDSLKCLICLEVARDPMQHAENRCGKLFCRKCWKKYHKRDCPNCRQRNPRVISDVRGGKCIIPLSWSVYQPLP